MVQLDLPEREARADAMLGVSQSENRHVSLAGLKLARQKRKQCSAHIDCCFNPPTTTHTHFSSVLHFH